MSFGPIMRFDVGKLTIELAPLNKDVMEEFVREGGMQSHTVTRYLGLQTAPTLEDEHEWYDKVRTDKTSVTWGIWDVTEGRTAIGTSALHNIEGTVIRQATSGSQIFRPEYWGKGIASHAHKARTWFAFHQLGLTRIKSAALEPNVGSWTALERSGYTTLYIERNEKFVDGAFVDMRCLECINPDSVQWSLWWGQRRPTRKALAARSRTREAMSWAETHVTLV